MSLNHIQIVCVILIASVILLIDSSMLLDKCDRCWNESKINWAIACSCISLIISILILWWRSEIGVYAHYFALFFILWWTFGVGVITFDSPYTVASNGYLSCWAAWCMSFYFCVQTVGAVGNAYSEAVETDKERFSFVVIMLASLVELLAGSVICSKDYECKKEVAFSVAAGAVSFIICILYLNSGDQFPLTQAAFFLFIWWTISTGVLTFGVDAPFLLVGNGYISTWTCFIGSLYLCHLGFGLGDKLVVLGGENGGGEGNPTSVIADDSKYEPV